MSNPLRHIRWIRRAALLALSLLFGLSLISVLSADRGQFGGFEFTRIVSVNGIVAHLRVRPTTGPSQSQPWQVKFAWQSDEDSRGISYRGAFNWMGVGFRHSSLERFGPGGKRYSSVGIGIPYWPFLLFLILPELGPWIRRARAKTIDQGHVSSVQPIETSTILDELPCVHCGYNLQTLQTIGRCPECGSLVADTLTLNVELAKSRPGWLKHLAIGNALLLLTRVLLIAEYFAVFSPSFGSANYTVAGVIAVIACMLYVAGTFLLTLNEHPFLRSPEQTSGQRQRILAVAVLICIVAGIFHQMYLPRGGGWSISLPLGMSLRGYGSWHLPALMLLLLGWVLYCVCTILEYRYLGKLAGRLLDRFMSEHCRIAGIGAGLSNLLALGVVRNITNWSYMPIDWVGFGPMLGIIALWMLFQLWTGFMNVYCALRFTQQAWLAQEHWQARNAETASVLP